jgi:hypothetical protein
MAFQVLQDAPKRLQEAPGGTQEASKRLPRGSKRHPGGLKDGSKRLANAFSQRLGILIVEELFRRPQL